MLLDRRQFELFADYHQFYLWDAGTNPQAPTDYDDTDVTRRIKTGPHVVVVQTESNSTVAVEVEVHDAKPRYGTAAWDHIAEASLHLPTGRLQVHECTGGPVADFAVAPGWYRVRSFHGGFAEEKDHYRVVLWPAPEQDVCVVKQWQPSA